MLWFLLQSAFGAADDYMKLSCKSRHEFWCGSEILSVILVTLISDSPHWKAAGRPACKRPGSQTDV